MPEEKRRLETHTKFVCATCGRARCDAHAFCKHSESLPENVHCKACQTLILLLQGFKAISLRWRDDTLQFSAFQVALETDTEELTGENFEPAR